MTATVLTPERVLRRLEWRVLRPLDGLLAGEHRTLHRGSGVDVADLREYAPGDDLRHVDWNVTARTDVAHVRQYLEDRDVTAWLVLDRSPSMEVGPAGRAKDRVLVEVAATLAQTVVRGGGRVGAVLFDDAVRETVPPGRGRPQTLRLISRLLAPPAPRTGRTTTDLASALAAAAGLARRRGLVVVVSDLLTGDDGDGDHPAWERPLALLARRHDVVVVRVTDPREGDLPAVGMVWVEDAETGEQIFLDTDDEAFRARLAAAAGARLEALTAAVRRCGADLHSVSTDDDLVRVLARVAAVRRRRR